MQICLVSCNERQMDWSKSELHICRRESGKTICQSCGLTSIHWTQYQNIKTLVLKWAIWQHRDLEHWGFWTSGLYRVLKFLWITGFLDFAYHLTFWMVYQHFIRPVIDITAKMNRYLTMFWPKDGISSRFKNSLFYLQFQILKQSPDTQWY
jgi:hypothetical protein